MISKLVCLQHEKSATRGSPNSLPANIFCLRPKTSELNKLRNDIQGEIEMQNIQEITVWHDELSYILYNVYCLPNSKCQIKIRSTNMQKTLIVSYTL